jgi:hypothetical protein
VIVALATRGQLEDIAWRITVSFPLPASTDCVAEVIVMVLIEIPKMDAWSCFE